VTARENAIAIRSRTITLSAQANLVVCKGGGVDGLAVIVDELNFVGAIGSIEDMDDSADGAGRKLLIREVDYKFNDVV
jgi:hypothetical protein